VGDEHDRPPVLVGDFAEQAENAASCRGVEIAGRLVGNRTTRRLCQPIAFNVLSSRGAELVGQPLVSSSEPVTRSARSRAVVTREPVTARSIPSAMLLTSDALRARARSTFTRPSRPDKVCRRPRRT
jgi:hypothetical protein